MRHIAKFASFDCLALVQDNLVGVLCRHTSGTEKLSEYWKAFSLPQKHLTLILLELSLVFVVCFSFRNPVLLCSLEKGFNHLG